MNFFEFPLKPSRIHDWRVWPIGARITIRASSFTSFGMVIANTKRELTVLWAGNCAEQLKTYTIMNLNPVVIMRYVDYEIKRKTGQL